MFFPAEYKLRNDALLNSTRGRQRFCIHKRSERVADNANAWATSAQGPNPDKANTTAIVPDTSRGTILEMAKAFICMFRIRMLLCTSPKAWMITVRNMARDRDIKRSSPNHEAIRGAKRNSNR